MALRTYFTKDYLGRALYNPSPGSTTNPTDYLGRLIDDPDDPDTRDNDETDFLGRLLTEPDD